MSLDALVVGTMQKDPNARPPMMDAFGEALAQIMSTYRVLVTGAEPTSTYDEAATRKFFAEAVAMP
jgi:hypothetical protein